MFRSRFVPKVVIIPVCLKVVVQKARVFKAVFEALCTKSTCFIDERLAQHDPQVSPRLHLQRSTTLGFRVLLYNSNRNQLVLQYFSGMA